MAPERCSSMPGRTARSSRIADSRLMLRACVQSSSVRASAPPGLAIDAPDGPQPGSGPAAAVAWL